MLSVAGALGGCIGGAKERGDTTDDGLAASAAELLGLGEIIDARIPILDGLTAHGTVYLPDVPDGEKVPVIMDLGPYYSDTQAYNTEFPPSMLYYHFLQRGYAVAFVSLRGTGSSEGCFTIGGPSEEADAAAIVEWLAAQAWSNGNVAMTGVSYDGTTPWEAAVTGTPGLKAIVPVEGISDMYRYSFFEGVPAYQGGGTLFHTYYMPLVDWTYLDAQGVDAWAAAQSTNVCADTPDVVLEPYKTWRDGGVHGPFWDVRDMSARLDKVEAATFVVHGFRDWNVKPDHVQYLWDDLPSPKRLLFGQWEHNIPWRSSLGRSWDYKPYNETITQWFDAFLKNDAAARDATLAARPVLAQDSRGTWWNLTEWPPHESALTSLKLDFKNTLVTKPSNNTATYRFQATTVADALGLGLAQNVGTAATSVALTSRAMRVPLHLMGNPEATFTISVDRPAGYLNAHLYDLDYARGRTEVTPGFVSLVVRESRDEASAVPVDTPFEVTVKFYAVNHVVEAGHVLQLVLESSDPSLNPVQPELTTFTVLVGDGNVNEVRLPVFAGALP